jgi:hypothetical protein
MNSSTHKTQEKSLENSKRTIEGLEKRLDELESRQRRLDDLISTRGNGRDDIPPGRSPFQD